VNPLSAIWNGLLGLIEGGLEGLHGLFAFAGDAAWGWAIIALTVVIRVLLLPLAIKQTRSMRAMQSIQPRVKAIQAKHKVDRDLLRRDPQAYKDRKAKAQEEVMALYKAEGVNPAAGCLPLVLQMPVFIALYQVLRRGHALADGRFYFPGLTLETTAGAAGVWGWVLIVTMAASMFWTQRQMLGRQQATADAAQLQQQKIMMYVMPLAFGAFARNFPLGILLYWVTTNLWTMGQQAIMIREVTHHPAVPEATTGKGSAAAAKEEAATTPSSPASARGNGAGSRRSSQPSRSSARADHLPRRPAKGSNPR
jgi:YidC/Oxa1 family membrane protein insertase